MHPMNILYLNHYAGAPSLGMEYRPYYLAREWVRSGHQVQVVACTTSHVRAQAPSTSAGPILQPTHQFIDGIDYFWIPGTPYQGNGLGRVKNIWSFLSQVWNNSDDIVKNFNPDVVIASSTYPMDIWVARRLARKARAKLVFEVHDLWPLSPIELSGMSPWHPFIMLCQKAENDAYRDSDYVVSMLPNVRQYMSEHGLDLSKLHIIPNGVATDEWAEEPSPLREDVQVAIRKAKAIGYTVLGYAGSMGLSNALDTLLDAAHILLKNKVPVTIVMVGGGHETERLLERVRSEGLQNVKLFPSIPKKQIPNFLKEIDVAYIGWQRVPIYRFGIAPNKLMDYMMAGCVVLHSVEAGNDPVAEAGCGLTVAPESASAVAEGLQKLMAIPVADRHNMGEKGRQFVHAHHTYQVLAQKFLQAISNK